MKKKIQIYVGLLGSIFMLLFFLFLYISWGYLNPSREEIQKDLKDIGNSYSVLKENWRPNLFYRRNPEIIENYVFNEDEKVRLGALISLRKAKYKISFLKLTELLANEENQYREMLYEMYRYTFKFYPFMGADYIFFKMWEKTGKDFENNAIIIFEALKDTQNPVRLPTHDLKSNEIYLEKKIFVFNLIKDTQNLPDYQIEYLEKLINNFNSSDRPDQSAD